jgi:hypothetical protein
MYRSKDQLIKEEIKAELIFVDSFLKSTMKAFLSNREKEYLEKYKKILLNKQLNEQ